MLHSDVQRPMTSYSKGAWGLFVLSRGLGILTETAISPSTWSRQCPSRYAIRAGRNLPDKEFRYLRTVIVTAAVNRGFGSKLLPCGMTSCLDLPAPSTCQPTYILVWSLRRPVFLINSHSSRFPATIQPFFVSQAGRHPLSRSYGVNLPSSFTRVLSSALGYAPRLPVSVLVRAPTSQRGAFLGG